MDAGSAGSPSRRKVVFWLLLGLVTLGGLGLRVAHITLERWDQPINGDARYYHETANHLADGDGLINPFLVEEGVSLPAADHPPLYTVYLSAFSLVGLDSPNQHVLVSAVLGAGTVLLAGLIGRQLGSDRLGILAALLVAVYPNVWRHDAMLMSETIAVFTTALAVWLAYRYLAAPSAARLALVGAVVGLATLARSELLLLAPLLVVPLLLVTTDRSWGERAKWLGAAAAACIVLVAPWVVRNWVQIGRPMLSSQLEITLATANCDSTYYGPLVGYWDFSCAGPILEEAGVTDPTDSRFDHVLGEAGQQYIRDNLDRTPKVMAIRLARNMTLYKVDDGVVLDRAVEGNTAWVASSSVWALRMAMVGGLIDGIVLRRRHVPVFPLLAPIATVVITVALLYSSGRFRAPADLALAILSAVAVDALINVVSGRFRRTPASGDRDAPSSSEREPVGPGAEASATPELASGP